MTLVTPYTISIMAAVSIFLFGASLVPSRSVLADRIEKLKQIPTRSVSSRSVLIEQVMSPGHRSRQQRLLLEAGWYHVSPTALSIRVIASIGISLVIALALILAAGPSLIVLGVAVMLGLLGWRLPYIVLARAIKTRREAVSRELPDFLDLLSSSVSAGLALNAAMLQTIDAIRGPLREEMNTCLSEIRLGRSRADALAAMAERMHEPQTTTMVTAIVQAERLGSNIASVLVELAKDTRERRWSSAEERAARLPILMLLPMALFMMPSLYLMIFGPVAAFMFSQHQ